MRMKDSIKTLLIAAVTVFGVFTVAGLQAAEQDVDVLFEGLQERGGSAEDILLGLMENGVELDAAAEYTVSKADSIGLSIAYAQAAVCLAPDQPSATAVGQLAADTASEAARNAVQAGVVSALSSYAKGECRLLLDELNNGAQAFAAPGTASTGGGPAGGGGTPSLDSGNTPVSESQ